MSASSSAAPASKPAPISYAERARRAQVKQAPATSTPRSSSKVAERPSAENQPDPGSSSAAAAADPLPNLAYTVASATPSSPGKTSNGTLASHSKSSSSSATPVVNIWNLRKEQMAQAARVIPNTSAKSQTLVPSATARSSVNASPMSSRPASSSNQGTLSSSNAGVSSITSNDPPQVVVNPPTVVVGDLEEEDPFIVRFPPKRTLSSHSAASTPGSSSGAARPQPVPPPVENKEIWPEVGKVPSGGPASPTASRDGESSSNKGADDKVKTKWIPIPATELQAAADAQRPPRQRSHSARSVGGGSGAASTSARTPSTNHSQATSAQSSPRTTVKRRLPEDSSKQSSTKPSRNPSPHPPTFVPNIPPPSQFSPPPQSSQPSSQPLSPIPAHAGPSQTFNRSGPNYYYGPPNTIPAPFPNPYQVSPRPPYYAPGPTHYTGSPSSEGPYAGMSPPVAPAFPTYEFNQPFMYWDGTSADGPPQVPPPVPPQQVSLPPPPAPPQQLSASPPNIEQVSIPYVMSPPMPYSRPPPPDISQAVSGYRAGRARRMSTSNVVFGTVGAPDGVRSPSPRGLRPQETERRARMFTAYSIGVPPNERARVTSQQSKSKSRTRAASNTRTEPQNGGEEECTDVQVIDLTDRVATFEFGTTKATEKEVTERSSLPPSAKTTDEADPFQVKDYGYGFGPDSGTGYGHRIAERDRVKREQQRRMEREMLDAQRREAQLQAERESQMLFVMPPPAPMPNGSTNGTGGYSGRPRRGSWGGYERGGGRGYNGRGRGFGGRGYGGRGFARGAAVNTNIAAERRHTYAATSPPMQFSPEIAYQLPYLPPVAPAPVYAPPFSQQPSLQQQQPPLQQTQPQPQPLPQQPAGHGGPPVPMPLSMMTFPLDPTRFYLLGQLEYYLSPQNMATDFFLRQKMDSRGWIPISLIASFNRVRALTPEPHLVKEVLHLSRVAEVRGEYVRMLTWESYVLPDAQPSTIEIGERPVPPQSEDSLQSLRTSSSNGLAESASEHEEEEEDVVFVLSR